MTEAIELSDARQKQPAPTFLYILRHVVGVCILLLAQHPRFHQGAAFFLGVWVGAAAIALAGASAIAGLAFLYFTNGFGRNWRLTFAVAAWSIAAMQLLG